MNAGVIRAMYGKEMLEIFRDRRTLISMVLVPLLVMPLILLAMGKYMASARRQSEAEASKIGFREGALAPDLAARLKGSGLELAVVGDLRKAVEDKTAAATIEATTSPSGQRQIRIYTDRTRQASQLAGEKLRGLLTDFKDETVKASLRDSGLSEKLLTPFVIERVNVAAQRKMAGFLWGSVLGYVVLLLMFSGGMYPAIDMTAGEKERRTLEALLASPAGRGEIVVAKILAVLTAILVTAALTVISMAYAMKSGGFGSSSKEFQEMLGTIPLDAPTLGLLLATLLPLSIMAASLMIAIALFARSFKEGQSYLTPLMMLVVFPAVLGVLPGMELTPAMALIPIFNASQLMRGILQGEFSHTVLAVTIGANLVYALAAFIFATRLFRNESVLFRS